MKSIDVDLSEFLRRHPLDVDMKLWIKFMLGEEDIHLMLIWIKFMLGLKPPAIALNSLALLVLFWTIIFGGKFSCSLKTALFLLTYESKLTRWIEERGFSKEYPVSGENPWKFNSPSGFIQSCKGSPKEAMKELRIGNANTVPK